MTDQSPTFVKQIDNLLPTLTIPAEFEDLYVNSGGSIELKEERQNDRITTISHQGIDITVDFRPYLARSKLKKRLAAMAPEHFAFEAIDFSALLEEVLEETENRYEDQLWQTKDHWRQVVDQTVAILGAVDVSRDFLARHFSKKHYKPYQIAAAEDKLAVILVREQADTFLGKAQKMGLELRLPKQKGSGGIVYAIPKSVPLKVIDHTLAFHVGTLGTLGDEAFQNFMSSSDKATLQEILASNTHPLDPDFDDKVSRLEESIETAFAGLGGNRHRVQKAFFAKLKQALSTKGKYGSIKEGQRSVQRALRVFAAEFKHNEEVYLLRDRSQEYSDYPASFPLARSMERKIIFYTGPTNSGKTYHALNRLADHETGVYLAPLRLLALEGQEELEKRGKTCSFLTGEERDIREGAQFYSSTIELLNLNKEIDCALIDEVQLVGDESRGWAWTAALVGVPAREVLLTGSEDAIPALKKLFDLMGESFEVIRHKRLSPLEQAKRHIPLNRVAARTAIIAFSRRDVLDIKEYIESTTDHKVSVIYGNLSPAVRREEARRFRAGDTDVLVSTDAIAMGLNLPIDTVLFFEISKFDGTEMRRLTPSELKQIAGRAGRYGHSNAGRVASVNANHMDYIAKCLNTDLYQDKPLAPLFRVKPELRHVSLIADVVGEDSLQKILLLFKQAIDFESKLFMPDDLDEMVLLAEIVDEHLQAPLNVKLRFAQSPCDPLNHEHNDFLMDMIEAINFGDEHRILDYFDFVRNVVIAGRVATSRDKLLRAEIQLKIMTLYAWISYRFPDTFQNLERCENLRDRVAKFIEASLRASSIKKGGGRGLRPPSGGGHRGFKKKFANR